MQSCENASVKMVDRMAETCASGDSPPSKRLSHHVSLTIFGQEASQLAADVRLRVHALVAGCFDIDVVVAVPVPIFPPGLPTRGAKQGIGHPPVKGRAVSYRHTDGGDPSDHSRRARGGH